MNKFLREDGHIGSIVPLSGTGITLVQRCWVLAGGGQSIMSYPFLTRGLGSLVQLAFTGQHARESIHVPEALGICTLGSYP